MTSQKDWSKEFDCFEYGCGECKVCTYLSFEEWAGSVAPAGSTIERDMMIENYLKLKKENQAAHSLRVREELREKVAKKLNENCYCSGEWSCRVCHEFPAWQQMERYLREIGEKSPTGA